MSQQHILMALNSNDSQGGEAEFAQIYREMGEVVASQKHVKKKKKRRKAKKAGTVAKDTVAQDEEGVEETDSERSGEDRGTTMSGKGHMNV